MDNSSLIKTPIAAELDDFKKLFDNSLTSSNFLLNEVISHIRQKNGKMMRPIFAAACGKAIWTDLSRITSCGGFP